MPNSSNEEAKVEPKKRGRKKGKGKELKDLLDQFQTLQGFPNHSEVKAGELSEIRNQASMSFDKDHSHTVNDSAD